ncbi:hypothetical protein S1OALGB6SA_914 [Olavius algarvensis spirochete endosymbiont]|nr:MAG: hypothetical protein [Olavius algarvensis spirochete endosymbiont]VDA99841.1 hypothetical protein S1OALGB6SA_914 [Olavius algarvensis spirochete endosymbiont]
MIGIFGYANVRRNQLNDLTETWNWTLRNLCRKPFASGLIREI